MKSVLMSFARKVLSETKAAIVFYPVNKVVDGKNPGTESQDTLFAKG